MARKVVPVKTRILQTGQTLNNEKGFTFLEILFVLVIMSLIMSIVVPNFNRMFASIAGVREGDKVLRLFEKARAEAILQAQPTEITFYTNGKCIFQLKHKVLEYEDLRMAVVLQEGDKITQTFHSDGTAEYEMLTFKTTEGKYLIYSFNPISGKIEMERSAKI